MSTAQFYDGLTDTYHTLYPDWQDETRTQADALHRLLCRWHEGPADIVDVACGSAPHLIGLARRGRPNPVCPARQYPAPGLHLRRSARHLVPAVDVARELRRLRPGAFPGARERRRRPDDGTADDRLPRLPARRAHRAGRGRRTGRSPLA